MSKVVHGFKHGDVVKPKRGTDTHFAAIITTERELGPLYRDEPRVALEAWRYRDSTRWIIHAHGNCEVNMIELHPNPDSIWADYTRALLLDDVQRIGFDT